MVYCVQVCVYKWVYAHGKVISVGPSGTTHFFTTEILDALIIVHVPSPEYRKCKWIKFLGIC